MNSTDIHSSRTPPPRAAGTAASRPLLSVRHLRVRFKPRSLLPWKRRGWIHAVDDLHLDLRPGETLGIFGESGCGKTTLARALAGLESTTSGSMRIDGSELAGLTRKQSRPLRRDVQMVSQNPFAGIGKKKNIGDIAGEPLRELCPEVAASERAQRVAAALHRVGLGETGTVDLPVKTLNAEQAQRLAIARAMILRPKLLICDEPLAGLDVPGQLSIAGLLTGLQREYGLAMIFISQDLAAIQQISSRVLVMYLGKVMEQAPVAALFAAPRHPYTRAMLATASRTEADATATDAGDIVVPLEGEMPSPLNPPMGCVFHTRCPFMESACVRSVPNLRRVGPEHYAACHFVGEV